MMARRPKKGMRLENQEKHGQRTLRGPSDAAAVKFSDVTKTDFCSNPQTEFQAVPNALQETSETEETEGAQRIYAFMESQ
jgi:ribonuclease HI